MATRISIVQHGEKESGTSDPGLTARGKRQAEAVAQLLSSEQCTAVVSSPRRRATETACIIAKALAVDVDQRDDLRERMEWAADTGLPLSSFLSEWQRATQDRDYRPRHGESSTEAATRMYSAVMQIAGQHGPRHVAVVSHGGVTIDFLRTLLGDVEVEARAPGLTDHGVPGGAITDVRVVGSELTVSVPALDHIPVQDRSGHRA